ncbi:MAG: BlaI/MecI/CopY family transcriptional regulator [Bryobacterales bacterium]|nr:BlaI/MecI/CopY family transcriptional regulator [Bryobacterales bacterium]
MRQPRQPKEIPPPLELECLKALWAIGEGNVRAVQAQLEARRKLAYTTVMTLLDRLVKKGGVSRRKAGRAFIYSPVLDRETLRRKAIEELAEALFEGSEQLLLRYVNGKDGGKMGAVVEVEERLDAALL